MAEYKHFSCCPATASTIDVSICEGEGYTVPSGDTTYLISGTYMDTIQNNEGCDSIVTINLSVEDVDVTLSQVDISLTAANEPNAMYQWVDCNNLNAPINGAIDQTFTPTQSESYAVIITLPNGCSEISECWEVNIVSLDNDDFQQIINVFPNPTKDIVFIDFNKNIKKAHLKLINSIGKNIFTQIFHSKDKLEIALTETPGVYFLSIQLSDGVNTVFKVVKN